MKGYGSTVFEKYLEELEESEKSLELSRRLWKIKTKNTN